MAKTKTAQRGLTAGSTVALNAGKKAARTRQYNKLLAEYNAETSAGKKSAIKRKMNALPTV